ncbi:MAG: hypothetical protein ABIJ27_03890 [Candidatus Omnitrophota bacterium]
MKKYIVYPLLLMVCLSTSGCAVVMATRQPDHKDLTCLSTGTLRDDVVAELGNPSITETNEHGDKVDVFQFKQGYSKGAKAGRALVHGVADVFTLGLWEVVGTPTEAIFSGKEMAVKVTYDKNNRIKKVDYLKGK